MEFKDIVNAVKNEAADAVEITKLRAKISKEKSSIKANFQKIGELIYEKVKEGGADEEIAGLVDEITASKEQISELKDKIEKVKLED